MGDVGLCAGCDIDLSKLAELACLEVEEPELDLTLWRLVWLPPPLGGGRMVSVVADNDRIGFGCIVELDVLVIAEALSKEVESDDDELEDEERAADALSFISSSIGNGGSGASYILGDTISIEYKGKRYMKKSVLFN